MDTDPLHGVEDHFYQKEFSQADYEEYTHSFSYIIKKVWIVIQALIMTQYMVRGLMYY